MRFRLKPAILILLSYVAAITLGTILLILPISSVEGKLSLIDSIFTATSGICVTGLVVVPTGTHFTLFGKLVILGLIQLGGLGIMTFSTLMFLSVGFRISSSHRWVIQESFTHTPTPDLFSLLKSIFIFTFLVELVGAIIFFFHWHKDFPGTQGIFYSLFHSISAFCNAGFSLFDQSFLQYRGDAVINLTLAFLIILGGIGFFVIYEIYDYLRRKPQRFRLSIHSKMVFLTTIFLVILGMVLIYSVEYNNDLLNFPSPQKFFMSFFQSITARTAGFNTVDLNLFHNAILFMLIIFMFVGASPGSCGGGVKTTTFAVLISLMWNRLMGRESVNVFRRTIPQELVRKVVAIFIIAVSFITLITFLLLITQPEGNITPASEGFFLKYLFEAVSAFGTVGLSLGVTSQLNIWGKLLLIITMYVGRVGLLTVAYGIAREKKFGPYQFAEENVMVG
jgi:trk system potassium uptake protein TrkH